MKTNKIFFFITLSFALLCGCKTDVDIIAPYREQAVIYGLLDASDSIQYIKVNKVFLGKGDATQFAQVPDSFNYKPEDIEVSLLRIKANGNDAPIILNDTIIPGAVSGTFNKDQNIIYYTREKVYADSEYKLTVKNKKSGYVAEATTGMIENVKINSYPTLTLNNISGTDYLPSVTLPDWLTVKNGKLYQLTMRFYYKEFTYNVGNDTAYKYIDWVFNTKSASSIKGGEEIKYKIDGRDFYIYLQNQKETYFSNNNVRRLAESKDPVGSRGRVGRVDFFATTVGEDYQIYRDLNDPANGSYQEKPVFTNVKNGIGILSCRNVSPTETRQIKLTDIIKIENGEYTSDLNFMHR